MKTLFKPTSYPKGAALAVGATFVWKAVSFANALLLALYFGATRQTDVYFYLMMLVGVGVGFLQRLNQSVLIPEAIFLARENEKLSRQFINMWLYLYLALALIVGTAGMIGTQPLWHVFSRFGGPVLAQDKVLLTCGFFLFGLQVITFYLTSIAEMYKFFKTAWLGVLNAVCPLLCLLLFANSVGILSMLYGFLIANVLQIFLLLYLLKTQLRWHFSPAWVPLRVQTRQNMWAGQTWAVLDMLTSWLPLYLISGMNAGLVSALNYCKQFTDSATEVFTARIANVAKIEMTEQAAAGQTEPFNQSFLRLNHVLLIILGPLVVFSCYFAPQIVTIFLERGHFDAQAAQDTVRFLRPMLFTVLLLIPAYLQHNTIYAWRKIKENFYYSASACLIFTTALLVFVPRWGAFSYAYITLGALGLGWLISYLFFRRYFPHVPFTKAAWDWLRLLVLNVVALLPAVGIYHLIPTTTAYGVIFICGSTFMAGYLLLLYLTHDIRQFLQEVSLFPHL